MQELFSYKLQRIIGRQIVAIILTGVEYQVLASLVGNSYELHYNRPT